jgi:hypothetical protein
MFLTSIVRVTEGEFRDIRHLARWEEEKGMISPQRTQRATEKRKRWITV